jgi:phosphatidylinositol alpha-1,6-mannosyltransferase
MRILLVSSIFAPGVGGSSRLLSEIADALVAAQHDVEVLCFDLGDDAYAFDRVQSYKVHRISTQQRRGIASVAMLGKLLLLAAQRPRFDLMLAGVAYPSVILVRAAQRVFGIPYVVYSHGEDVTAVKSKPLAAAVLGDALRGARLVMTNSNFTRRAILEHGLEPDSVVCVHPWIDPTPYKAASVPAARALKARLGLADRTVIFTLARLAPRKGHDTVIRALPEVARHVPNAHYLVVGLGDTSVLTRLAAEQGVADRVTIVPYVADAELPLLFALCDVYVMVSRWDPISREVEGFGIVFLEAAACGKPAIAGSQGGSPDAVEDGLTGRVVDPESVPQLQAALSSLLREPELAGRMGLAGRERVDRLFEKRVSLRRVEELLQRALAREVLPGATTTRHSAG